MEINSGVFWWVIGIVTTLNGLGFAYAISIEHRFSVLETKMDVFWKNVGKSAADILHSPHRPELDRWLERYQAGELSRADLQTMVKMMRDVQEDDTGEFTKTERMAASVIELSIHNRYGIQA